MANYDYTFKIIMLGDAPLKTSLTIRYISGFYLEDLKLTVGVDFYSKTTNFHGKKIELQIWDFGGEERFRFLRHQYCKGANAAFFIYDITNPRTLEHLPDWAQIIRKHAGDIPILLIGANAHLEKLRAVSREEGIAIAEKHNLSAFAEVSAKTGQNVDQLFNNLIEILVELNKSEKNKKRSKQQDIKNGAKNLVWNKSVHNAPKKVGPLPPPNLPELMPRYYPKISHILEKQINQYITLKLENGRTFIYVNGGRFIQCIRLVLNIQKEDIPLYDEIESIDETANVYKNHIYQNRIVRGPMAAPVRDQSHDITPEQEFWGHCSNLQAWVENDYDTRILMSNISFPLLRVLSKAGDPKARKVYKEEIALRLESGYPSVVQYLLVQGYITEFTPEEFETILETTDLIPKISSDIKVLYQLVRTCAYKFPALGETITLQIKKLPNSKYVHFLQLLFGSRCTFCGKEIPKERDNCEWCGHRRPDDDDLLKFPFKFRRPDGGDGSMKAVGLVSSKT